MQRYPVYLTDVTTLTLDTDKCTGCGTCLQVCPHAVLSVDNGKARVASRDACMECGACAQNCPVAAISVQRGVGCAMAVINTALGRDASSCCCVLETPGADAADCGTGEIGSSGCC